MLSTPKRKMVCAVGMLLLVAETGLAGVTVVGRGVEFAPSMASVGDQVVPVVRFRVEGERTDLFINYLATFPRRPGMGMPPTVISGVVGDSFPVGDHAMSLPPLTLPRDYSSICFGIQAGIGSGSSRQPLVEGACLGETTLAARMENRGEGLGVWLAPGRVVGLSVEMAPSRALPGASVTLRADFRVEGSPVDMNLRYKATPVVRPGLSLPSAEGEVRVGRRSAGSHSVSLPGYRIPTSDFDVIHYTVYVQAPGGGALQTLINDARMISEKGYVTSSTGSGRRITSP